MQKNFGYLALLISFIVIVIWLISYFVQPILPPEYNRAGILFFASLVGVFGFFAILNDVVEFFHKISPKYTASEDKIEKLIEKIQDNLHGDITQLPYVLSLVSILCDQTSQTKYDFWLNKELYGYDDFRNFAATFEDEEAFQDWMKQFGEYRIIQSYVDMRGYVDNVYKVTPFPYNDTLIPYALSNIVEAIKVRKADGVNRVEVPILSLGKEHLAEFVEYMAQHNIPLQPTAHTVVYFKLDDFEKIVRRVRKIVLQIVKEAGRRATKDNHETGI